MKKDNLNIKNVSNGIQMNTITSNNIHLNEENHIYTLDGYEDIKFTSVTTIVDSLFEKFNAELIAEKLVNTHSSYKHLTTEELLTIWKQSAVNGTKIHKQIEDFISSKINASDSKAQDAIKWLDKITYGNKHTLYTEKIIYSKELKIAGSIDLLIKLDDINEYIIVDWKTNKKIDIRSFNNKVGIHNISKNIEDCKFNKYSMQLSLYRYILEEYYGLKINKQIIAHLTDEGVRAYISPYYKSEMNEIKNLRIS
tara:strand:- start:2795 stop:3553 length:759 start_codon:yes stop_codon:yes gene_type:complete